MNVSSTYQNIIFGRYAGHPRVEINKNSVRNKYTYLLSESYLFRNTAFDTDHETHGRSRSSDFCQSNALVLVTISLRFIHKYAYIYTYFVLSGNMLTSLLRMIVNRSRQIQKLWVLINCTLFIRVPPEKRARVSIWWG